jgi:hypothetical protein
MITRPDKWQEMEQRADALIARLDLSMVRLQALADRLTTRLRETDDEPQP